MQSDPLKYFFKAVQGIFSIFSLLDTFYSLSLVQKPVWPASFCISGLLCVYQGQIQGNGG